MVMCYVRFLSIVRIKEEFKPALAPAGRLKIFVSEALLICME